ncbi:WD40/YVTN/BNR-like repeat-containing protein [Delftia sp. WSY_4]|uniref:WD40/YVTN/BNR-like repeat-containing protein n=1 Tax=unclassified Delftia TaxID=2613839 RepID=UPI00370B66EE
MNQSLSDLLGVNSLPPIGSVNLLPDVADAFGIQKTQGKTYLRAGVLARASLFPGVPNHLKPVGNMAAKASQPLPMPIGDMASDGKNTVVAVAFDSTIFVSTDAGDNWVSRGKLASAAGYAWSIATDGNGVWLAMARDGTVIRSTDNFASWNGTLTPAQAGLLGSVTYPCRLDYVNGEFWATRVNLPLSVSASNNNHLYRLSSSGAALTPISLPATGANSASFYLCGVFGNGKDVFAIFNMAGVTNYAPGANTWTYAYQLDKNTGVFSAPYVICYQPAMTMTWDDAQQLWLVYGNNVYYSSGAYTYCMDVRLYDSEMKLVASWGPNNMTTPGEGYYPGNPVGEVISWGVWGVMIKPNRNYCLDFVGRSGSAPSATTYFTQRAFGARVDISAFAASTSYIGAGVKVSRDLVLVHSNAGARDVYRVFPCVGLVYPNRPSLDTSMFLRVA